MKLSKSDKKLNLQMTEKEAEKLHEIVATCSEFLTETGDVFRKYRALLSDLDQQFETKKG